MEDYIQILPTNSQTKLLHGEKINNNGIVELAISIARSIMSVDMVGYNTRNEALENFNRLDISKFLEINKNSINIIIDQILQNQKADFISGFAKYEKELNPSKRFNLITTLTTASTQNIEVFGVDKAKAELYTNQTANFKGLKR
ncbi:MAG: hypothetical protein AB8U25_03000 [Rickettsiales endosymbiont of Dermacentor nuttalli]